ncbi:MAG TPA: SCO family protein [Pyrinomonadaceae bacterium]|jgi:cytochrome oxidase Cu insertion factor (SCO1/SenC/PrrC family)
MKLALTFLFVLLVCAEVGVVRAQSARYSCPMHPDVTSTKPGKCRKCGMTLVKQSAKQKTKAEPEPEPRPGSGSDAFSSTKIPDAEVLDQNGKQLNFYSDLIKGKTVAINFIFTTCTTICPPLTATFRRVQQDARAQGLDVQLISVSVDPITDTPERLRDFAAKFKAEPGWTFVTGEKARIDSVLQALGAAVSNKNDHTPMILIGNDESDYWTRAYGLTSPAKIVDLLSAAAKRKASASFKDRGVQLPYDSANRIGFNEKIDLQSLADTAHDGVLSRDLVSNRFDLSVCFR